MRFRKFHIFDWWIRKEWISGLLLLPVCKANNLRLILLFSFRRLGAILHLSLPSLTSSHHLLRRVRWPRWPRWKRKISSNTKIYHYYVKTEQFKFIDTVASHLLTSERPHQPVYFYIAVALHLLITRECKITARPISRRLILW